MIAPRYHHFLPLLNRNSTSSLCFKPFNNCCFRLSWAPSQSNSHLVSLALNCRQNIVSIGLFSTNSIRSQVNCRDTVMSSGPIKIFNSTTSLRQWRRKQLFEYRSVGLVPTMGALHEGHISLIRLAARENAVVVVSIFVNPAQFDPNEDLDNYPKTTEKDIEILRELDKEIAADGRNFGKIAVVFAPKTTEMYPDKSYSQEINGRGSFVTITPLSELLEGANRPVHFRGVATICMKLFNVVTPERVYFGQKDVQQTVLIKKMVRDFCIDTQVIVGVTKRADDGLALSSRNVYLGVRRRRVAPVLYNSLRLAEKSYLNGAQSRAAILEPALKLLSRMHDEQEQYGKLGVRFKLDYISLADPETMEEIQEVDSSKGAVVSGAIRMLPLENAHPGEDLGLSGGPMVRLLDNVILAGTKNDKKS